MDLRFYLLWLAALSLVTFTVYGFDKSQSKGNGWRVPESVLHGLAVAGGFVGGWLGQSIFHHKTKKASFVFVLAISTMVHAAALYWFFLR